MRSVVLLLASLVIAGIAVQRFGYGTVSHSLAAAPSAAQTQAEHALTLLDVWAQSVVPSMLLEHSRSRSGRAGDVRFGGRLARRLRIGLLRAESFDADLKRDPELRTGDSIDARALQQAASAWRDWAVALLRLSAGRSQRGASRVAALEARAVRLHQSAYVVVDTSLRMAVSER